MDNIIQLSIEDITVDASLQTRFWGVNEDVVREYTELMADGKQFPPIIVFYDGKNYWLADGFHRLSAVKANNGVATRCEVRNGSRRDAELYAMTEANVAHGFQLTRADKRKRVDHLLNDPEWSQLRNSEIGTMTGTSKEFVRQRRELLNPKPLSPEAQRLNEKAEAGAAALAAHRNGNVATTNTGGYKVTVFKVNDRVKTNDDRTGTIRYITFREDGHILHAVYLDNSQTTHNYGALVLTLIERDVAKAHWFNAGSTAYIAKRQDAAKVVRIEHDRTAMLKFEDGTLETVSWSYVLTQPRDPNAKEIVSELESGNVATGAPDPVHNRDWYWRNALTRLFETFPKWQRYAGVVPLGETGWFNGNRETLTELHNAGLVDVENFGERSERIRINQAGCDWLGTGVTVNGDHMDADDGFSTGINATVIEDDEVDPYEAMMNEEDAIMDTFASDLADGLMEAFESPSVRSVIPSLAIVMAAADGHPQFVQAHEFYAHVEKVQAFLKEMTPTT